MIRFVIAGRIREAESGIGLRGLFVKAYDKDLLFDDLLGTAFTDEDGRFEIISEPADFRDFFEVRPDIYLKLYAPDRETVLASTEDKVRWNAGRYEVFDVRIRRDCLGPHAPRRTLDLLGDDGVPRESFQVGESLTLHVAGLRPSTAHRVAVRDEAGELFTDVLISNKRGTIEPTVIWPLLGIEDPRGTGPVRVEDAHERWRNRRLRVTLADGERIVGEATLDVEGALTRPLVVGADRDGYVRHGFEVGEHDARVMLYSFSRWGRARVFMVPRQQDWRVGDAIRPVAMVDVQLEAGRAEAIVARAQELRPGAYDFVVRRLRYGYEDDDDLALRAEDVMCGRRTTGLVVREKFMPSKVVQGGCANLQPIAGRVLKGAPYVQFTDVFQVGEDVYGALDPAALDPTLASKMVALYVVPHKEAASWSADGSLQHLAVLGGNAAVQKWLTQSWCVNANLRLLWPAASQPGEYDIVADFGNNTGNPASFAPDAQYNMPLDIIDGYIVPGFRVTPDPTVDTSFTHSGTFEYDESTQGSLFVTEDNEEVPLRAVVFFPADVPLATSISQLSQTQELYPLVVVVHHNSDFEAGFRGYNYLLEHLARNGFLAVSIYQNGDMGIRGRARVLRKHLEILFNMFSGHVDNNVGIMGHSRGGEAVFQAAGLNQVEAWGYNINAVISLAPTAYDTLKTYSAAWTAPYLVIYGSLDADVTGPDDTGFELYDHAAPPKSMAYVYGACHTRFNTEGGDLDVSHSGSNLHPLDRARVISAASHQAIAVGYMTTFYRQHLRGEAQWAGIFRGEWVPAAVQSSSPGLKIYMQYQDTIRRTIDDFEGPHTDTSWQTSTIGGGVSQSGLAMTPVEGELSWNNLSWNDPIVPQSPHTTGGLRLSWSSTGSGVWWDVPPEQCDVTSFAALSFRIGQIALVPNPVDPWSVQPDELNPIGQPQDLRVALSDGAGRTRAIRVSKFAEVPYPEIQVYEGYMMSQMRTVRIPLSAYTIRCAGVEEVDLTNITRIHFGFTETTTGDLLVDSIEFTQ